MSSMLQMPDLFKTGLFSGPEQKPETVAELGVREAFLEDLALKTLYVSGSLSVLELSEKMRVDYQVGTEFFVHMRSERFCQVVGMAGNIPHISITTDGRNRAGELLSHSQYAGPAPVTLESYVEQVKKQSVRDVNVRPDNVERAFAHLVVDPERLRQFGTALNSGSAVFLYGPPGTGKTTFAETLSHVLSKEDVWIPYAIEIDGQVITVFDPSIHQRSTDSNVGALDLQFNPQSKFYVGPVQMKANNGVLIIDDFGRQRVRPEELLNRWVVPLDRRIDFLTLAGGKKIEMPFEMLVVFASNIDPAELVDQAFLRRIQTKIKIGSCTDEQFTEIFRRYAKETSVEWEEGICNDLIQFIRNVLNQELRSCYPRDIVNQVRWAARYEGKTPFLDRVALMRAVEAYFLPTAN